MLDAGQGATTIRTWFIPGYFLLTAAFAVVGAVTQRRLFKTIEERFPQEWENLGAGYYWWDLRRLYLLTGTRGTFVILDGKLDSIDDPEVKRLVKRCRWLFGITMGLVAGWFAMGLLHSLE